MLFRNRILSVIDKADMAALLPHMTEVTWGANYEIYDLGEPVADVHFPSSAGLSLIAVMADGAEVECATVGCEGAVGILSALSGAASSNRIRVQLAGSGISMSATALSKQAAKSPALLQLLLRSAQTLIAQNEQSVACVALHDVEARLARWLLICQDRLDAPVLPVTQEHLSLMLGMQRTTVSAAAGVLRGEGLIRYSRGQIEIVDRSGLHERSCECYDTVLRRSSGLLEIGAP